MPTTVQSSCAGVCCWWWILPLAASWLAVQSNAEAAEKKQTGQQIYRQLCAECHGAHGEGNKAYHAEPLVGDKSVKELTQLIVETMPDGAEEECVGRDAELVAAYIYDAFYSQIAQARNAPAKIEFSRLTVRQYEHSIADLLGTFLPLGQWDDQRGIGGEYFYSRRFRGDARAFARRDATIDFDFGKRRPGSVRGAPPVPDEPEKDGDKRAKDTQEFSVRWTGGVMAPETGDYEFILHTENGARLWVNDQDIELIDAWVKSGAQTEYRATIRLLGGRVYPLKLEFFRHKEATAAIQLKWKPPHLAEQVIPQRLLSPNRHYPTAVVTTPFPPDDRSIGYERGTSISKEWDEATTYAALEVANKVVAHLPQLARVKPQSPDAKPRTQAFLRRFVERAFRRPLSEEETRFFVDRYFATDSPIETAVRRAVILILKSPRFLYREAGVGEFDEYGVASWLSYALWDSLPDQRLLDGALRGDLASRKPLDEHLDRMLSDQRTQSKLREFFHQWLKVDRIHDIEKDAERFPGFDVRVASDMRTSLDLFLAEIMGSEGADFRQLLLSDGVYLNGRLAQFYGMDLPADAPFERVALEPAHRAGVLSHPFLLAGFAYEKTSSPIHRGVFVARSLLGRRLQPPPEAVTPFSAELQPDLTTRERVALQTKPSTCQRCHSMINPLGFSLERFDAVGRYRENEKGRAVEHTGRYITRTGEEIEFSGARGLATFLANSEEAQEAFIEQLFQYTIKQPIRAFGEDELTRLRLFFAENQFNIRKLLVEMVASSALTARRLAPEHEEPRS